MEQKQLVTLCKTLMKSKLAAIITGESDIETRLNNFDARKPKPAMGDSQKTLSQWRYCPG